MVILKVTEKKRMKKTRKMKKKMTMNSIKLTICWTTSSGIRIWKTWKRKRKRRKRKIPNRRKKKLISAIGI